MTILHVAGEFVLDVLGLVLLPLFLPALPFSRGLRAAALNNLVFANTRRAMAEHAAG